MPVIRTPYRYRVFKHSRLATFVDRHTHKPTSRILLALLTSFGVLWLGDLLRQAGGQQGVLNSIGIAVMVLGGVWFYLGGFVIPKLADHFDWAGRIAERARVRKGLDL